MSDKLRLTFACYAKICSRLEYVHREMQYAMHPWRFVYERHDQAH